MRMLKSIWFFIRHLSIIHPSFKHGKNFKMKYFNIIYKNVIVGDDVKIENFVLLKEDSIFGNNCYIDSYVLTSGSCKIGNGVFLRYQSIVARNVIIEDDVFLCAGVKTIYLNHKRNATIKPLIIKKGCFLGDCCVILGGVIINEGCIIGANAFVSRDTIPFGVYVGVPAKFLRTVKEEEKR